MQYHPPETAELAAIREREREIGVPLDYQRDMANAAPGSALRLQEIGRLVRSDQAVPPQVAAMAALGAVLAEDCGECVQIQVNLAAKAGVEPRHLKAALEHRLADLPADLKLGLCFGRVVCENDPMLLEKGAALEALFGRKALVDLALAVALARFYPTVKRALGHARSCTEVKVEIPG
ncbi:MAG TPA: carboxymuconolactone decarboxylase family protein [Candidatus Binatia bacterium]|nr:carboxymuconolactone decarboxylase family protein [Candidatus Binatia bacterium]